MDPSNITDAFPFDVRLDEVHEVGVQLISLPDDAGVFLGEVDQHIMSDISIDAAF